MANPTILILDNDPEFLERLSGVLCMAGFETFTAVDVESAKLVLAWHKIDLFIVNLVLPGLLSGFDVISASTKDTPPFKIIGISSAYRESALDEFHPRLRVDAFLEKEPFNAAEWIATVRHLFGVDVSSARP